MREARLVPALDAMNMPPPNIVQAMDTIFAPLFRRRLFRGDSWRAWKVFLAAAFALPMDADARRTYERHTGRTDLPTEQAREAMAVVGRRGGKSLIAALVAVYLAVFRDYRGLLAPGEQAMILLLAADRRQAGVIFRYITGFFETVPQLRKMVVAQLKESIELDSGITISVQTSDFRKVRGTTVVCAILDELAFWSDENSANPASEVVAALRPAMATVPNALLLGISSPYGKTGFLWESYQRHYGKPGARTFVWNADTRSMNPHVSAREIATAYELDPVSAASEYGALFRDDVGGFVDRSVVESCLMRGVFELPPAAATQYCAFVDPSGGSSDSFTLAIGHRRGDVAVLDLLREAKPPFSPENVVAEFSDTLKTYRVHTVVGDRYAGEWPREQFRKRGISYRVSDHNRSELYLEMLPVLNSRRCELLDHAKLVAQLCSLERKTGRAADSIDHAAGSHDDVANACAGALVEAIGHEVHFAVIESIKSKLAAQNDPTPAAPDQTLRCPDCGYHGLARIGPMRRCGRCGVQFVAGSQPAPPQQRTGRGPRTGLFDDQDRRCRM